MVEQPQSDVERRKEIVRESLDRLWNEGELSFVDEYATDDLAFHDLSRSVELRGSDAFRAYVRERRTAFPDFEITEEDILCEGDSVALRWTWRGTHENELMGIEPTGATVEGTGMTMIRFDDGAAKEQWNITAVLNTMQQLGVVDPPDD